MLVVTAAFLLCWLSCAQAWLREPCGYAALPWPSFMRPRILNGTVTHKCEWPWMVAVRENRPIPRAMCAGVLVSRDRVITTASCARYLDGPLQVVVGEHDFTLDDEMLFGRDRDEAVSVSSVVSHPRYSANSYDIAVVRLSRRVVYGMCVLPACLPKARGPLPPGQYEQDFFERCGFGGWGLYTDKNFHRSAKLRAAWGNYISPRVCSLIYQLGRNNMLPAATGCLEPIRQDQRPCGGDEGGMVSCPEKGQWVVEALVSVPSCQDRFPSLGVDLRDPDVLNFIFNN